MTLKAVALAALLLSAGASAREPAHPYTLVIVGAQQNTTINYPSREACMKANAEIRAQFPATQYLPNGGIVYSTPPQAFCVPR